jgi:hypothetical protein
VGDYRYPAANGDGGEIDSAQRRAAMMTVSVFAEDCGLDIPYLKKGRTPNREV